MKISELMVEITSNILLGPSATSKLKEILKTNEGEVLENDDEEKE